MHNVQNKNKNKFSILLIGLTCSNYVALAVRMKQSYTETPSAISLLFCCAATKPRPFITQCCTLGI